MTLLLSQPGIQAHHADHRALAAVLPRRADGTCCDALVTDAPYSAKTHRGHDSGMTAVNGRRPVKANGVRDTGRERRTIDYAPWGEADVDAFVSLWSPLTRGWFVSITDDQLAPLWATALLGQGRYVFAPLPFVSPGSRVRLTGDGPSNWTCWIVVARPSCPPFSKWGTLCGRYEFPPEDMPVVGGKPVALLRALIRDYSRPGDVVCDPCMGAATAGVAAKLEGRTFVGGDADLGHAEIGAERLRGLPSRERAGQRVLFGAAG